MVRYVALSTVADNAMVIEIKGLEASEMGVKYLQVVSVDGRFVGERAEVRWRDRVYVLPCWANRPSSRKKFSLRHHELQNKIPLPNYIPSIFVYLFQKSETQLSSKWSTHLFS